MLKYTSYTLLLESKKRDKKLAKQREKIKKFLIFEPIINYVFDKVIGEDGTKGLQYTIWFADKLKEDFINVLVESGFMKNLTMTQMADLNILSDANNKFVDNKKSKKFLNDVLSDVNKLSKIKKELTHQWEKFKPSGMVTVIVDWLKSPIREEEIVDLQQYKTLKEAGDRANEWHDNIKATGVVINEKGTVLMTFEDGHYWIDLETNSDEDEANAMGHCGTTTYGDTLYSLRRKQSPHVTTAIKSSEGEIFQMKGRNNEKPTEKYHSYIVELLSYPNVSENVRIINEFQPITQFSTIEYDPDQDFHLSDLSGKDLKIIAENNKILIKSEGFGIKYKLYKENYITKEEVISGYSDLKIINNEIHFIVDEWMSFDVEDIFAKNNDYRDDWQKEVINGDYDINYYDTQKFDYQYHWDDLESRIFTELLEIFDEKKYSISYDDGEEFTISSKNSEISPNKDDIWIKTPIGGVISLKSLLDKKNIEIDTKEGEIEFYSSDLDVLREAFDNGFTSALELADSSAAWDFVTDKLINTIGNLIKKNNNDKMMWWEDGLHFNLDLEWFSTIANHIDRDSVLATINDIRYIDSYDNEYLIDCDPPYNGFHGTIDGDTLTEEILNKLYE